MAEPGHANVDAAVEGLGAAVQETPTRVGRRALVVDDEPEVTATLAEMLARDAWQVDTADSGEAALDQVIATDYDVILSDIRMPNLGGLELYHRLKQAKPELARRFIVVTGDTLSGAVRAFLDDTGLPCLEKPFNADEVRKLAAAAAAGEIDGSGKGSPAAGAP
jgi:two-component system NtrC family sensor kinase